MTKSNNRERGCVFKGLVALCLYMAKQFLLFSSAAVLVDLVSLTIFLHSRQSLIFACLFLFPFYVFPLQPVSPYFTWSSSFYFLFDCNCCNFFWHSWVFILATLTYHRSRRDFLNFISFLCNMSLISMIFVHSSVLLLVPSFTGFCFQSSFQIL